MYRQKELTVDEPAALLQPKIENAADPYSSRENNIQPQVQAKGDPAAAVVGPYQIPAGFYERHTRVFE